MYKYKRILLKLSGESLLGNQSFGINFEAVSRIALDIKEIVSAGVEVAIVIGGGNIFRGLSGVASGMKRATGDCVGMLATVMNSIVLQNSLESLSIKARVMSAIPMPAICDPFIRREAIAYLEQGTVCIFAAGSGNPFFTTDTAAALRAAETDCQVILKGTKPDGVYNKDPIRYHDAEFLQNVSYADVLSKNLRVMDAAAISLARDNDIPIIVFSIYEAGNLSKVLKGEGHYTTICDNV